VALEVQCCDRIPIRCQSLVDLHCKPALEQYGFGNYLLRYAGMRRPAILEHCQLGSSEIVLASEKFAVHGDQRLALYLDGHVDWER
jgi:prepilin-type processing-associated H-X9-DG protein